MLIFLSAWLLLGFAFWLTNYSSEIGLIPHILVGLPMCLIFAPLWMIQTIIEVKRK